LSTKPSVLSKISGALSLEIVQTESGIEARFANGKTYSVEPLSPNQWSLDFRYSNIVLISGQKFISLFRKKIVIDGQNGWIEKYQSRNSKEYFIRISNPFLNGFNIDGLFKIKE